MEDLKKITAALKKIRLSEEDRSAARSKLILFMEENPYSPKLNIKESGFWTRFHFLMRRPIWAPALAVILLVTFTGTATYASESALPGDLLYGFKVNVVEEVRGALQFSAEEKAAWEAARMKRRFEEVEELKAQGKLSPEAKLKIKEQMEKHQDTFKNRLEELKKEGEAESADEMELKFRSILEEQQKLQEEFEGELLPKNRKTKLGTGV